MQRIKSIYKYVSSPTSIVLGLSLIILVLSLSIFNHAYSYSSDDVSWQNILLTWKPFNGHTVYMGGSDNYVLKIPFFYLFSFLFSPGRTALFIESVFFAVLTFIIFYYSALYFLKKLGIKTTFKNLLPFLWFASFTFAIAKFYLNPILRNFELGLAFLYFMLAARYYYDEINPLRSWVSKIITILLGAIAGALVYSDPYFLYFTVIPIILLFIALYSLKKVSLSKLLVVIGTAVISGIFAVVTSRVVIASGLHLAFNDPVQFIPFSQLFAHISLTIRSILNIMASNFFGNGLHSLATVSSILNFSILVFIFYKVLKSSKIKNLSTLNDRLLWSMFFGLLGLFAIAVFALSSISVASDPLIYRYLIIMNFSFIVFLAITLGTLKAGKNILAGLIIISILINFGYTLSLTTKSQQYNIDPYNQANFVNFDLINTIQSLGISKGYVNYWDGDINTYLTAGKIQFLPVTCIGNNTKPLDFLVDYNNFSIPAKKSFYIDDRAYTNPLVCPLNNVLQQFGQPQRIIKLGVMKILVYNYDIYSRM